MVIFVQVTLVQSCSCFAFGETMCQRPFHDFTRLYYLCCENVKCTASALLELKCIQHCCVGRKSLLST